MGISLGLVGLGAFGRAFADMFMSHPLVDKVALCDMEADRIARFAEKDSWKAKFNPSDTYETFDEIVEADLDALVVITQPWLHAPQCVKAMEMGKHVYSAVPIISVPDGDEILDWIDKLVKTAEATGQSYMLGETTYFRPEAMYARRRAAQGDFGRFVYSEGEYYHDVDLPACNLRDVMKSRTSSKSGREWLKIAKEKYAGRNIKTGPMHYPTHSISGPMCVMQAHAKRVSCFGVEMPADVQYDDYFKGNAFPSETAIFQMSNGSVMRINEFRMCGCLGREMFSVMGSEATFWGSEWKYGPSKWMTRGDATDLTTEEMRDPLPDDVLEAFTAVRENKGPYGGHGGSHAGLVHEFVSAVAEGRQSVINAWEAARYMAAGVMAHKSALKGGETLDVPDWGDAPK